MTWPPFRKTRTAFGLLPDYTKLTCFLIGDYMVDYAVIYLTVTTQLEQALFSDKIVIIKFKKGMDHGDHHGPEMQFWLKNWKNCNDHHANYYTTQHVTDVPELLKTLDPEALYGLFKKLGPRDQNSVLAQILRNPTQYLSDHLIYQSPKMFKDRILRDNSENAQYLPTNH